MAAIKTQKHLSLSCAIEMQPNYSRAPTREMNISSSTRIVQLAKTKVITHIFDWRDSLLVLPF